MVADTFASHILSTESWLQLMQPTVANSGCILIISQLFLKNLSYFSIAFSQLFIYFDYFSVDFIIFS